MSSFVEQQIALTTPRGRTVIVNSTALGAIVDIVEDARARAFDEVVEILDKDHARMKDCGDNATAELIEMLRAKVRAKAL